MLEFAGYSSKISINLINHHLFDPLEVFSGACVCMPSACIVLFRPNSYFALFGMFLGCNLWTLFVHQPPQASNSMEDVGWDFQKKEQPVGRPVSSKPPRKSEKK